MNTIQFVQCAHLGATFSFRIDESRIYLTGSFAHKKSPSGKRSNFEQFCRATGRRVVENRMKWLTSSSSTNPPYSAIVNTEGEIPSRSIRATIWGVLENTIQNGAEEASVVEYDDQVDNDELFTKIVDALEVHGSLLKAA